MTLTIQWHIEDTINQLAINGDDLPIIIGRQLDCHIVIPNEKRYRTVSRQHASIFKEEGRYWIDNLSSTNTMQVNNEILEYTERTGLAAGDVIRIGKVKLEVLSHESSTGNPLVKCPNGHVVEMRTDTCPWCGYRLDTGETII